MMRNYRRPMLSLTALLDLLLITIFAQFLEVKTAVDRDASIKVEKEEQLASRQKDLERRIEELQSEKEMLETSLAKADTATQENVDLRKRQADLDESLKTALAQRDLLGQLTSEVFKLPPGVIEKTIKPGDESRLSPKEIEDLKKQARELAENRAGATTRHLLTWSELRKRSDVWDVTLDDSGLTSFNPGNAAQTFRAATPEAFAREIFDRYKTAPQPKGLVIMLVWWGNTPARWREAAIEGVRIAADRMREDSAGRTRFEYAILGFRPGDSK